MFDDIKYLFNNIKKSRRIRGISKVLGDVGDISNSYIRENMNEIEIALNELLELCETDPYLYYVMENYT